MAHKTHDRVEISFNASVHSGMVTQQRPRLDVLTGMTSYSTHTLHSDDMFTFRTW